MRPVTAVLAAALTVPLLTSPAQAAPDNTARLGKNFAKWNGRTLYVYDLEDDGWDVYAGVFYRDGKRPISRHYDTSGWIGPSKHTFSAAKFRDVKDFWICEERRKWTRECSPWIPRP